MTGRDLLYLLAVVTCYICLIQAAADSSKVLDLSKGKYTREDLKRSELLKHGDASQWEEIDLSGNAINEVDDNTFLGFENLKKLSLSSNSLGTIEDNWFRGTKLTSLDLSSNILVTVRSNAFTDLSDLIELNLANNLMRPFKTGTFTNNQKLIKLNLENNPRAHNLFKNVTINSLEELNLKTCRITNLKMVNFENMPNLKKVNLEGNVIHDLDEGSLKSNSKIRELNLRGNALIHLKEPNFKRVFGANTNVVVHMDYDDLRCQDCTLNSCEGDERLQRYLCEYPKNETAVFKGVFQWKNEAENTVVTFISH